MTRSRGIDPEDPRDEDLVERWSVLLNFSPSVQEIERTRLMSMVGLGEVCRAYEREVSSLEEGDEEGQDALPGIARRARFATLEIQSDFPVINAQALVALNSALDGLVEYLAPLARDFPFEAVLRETERQDPAIEEVFTPAQLREFLKTMQGLQGVPRLERLRGKGATRYERRMASGGLTSPPDRAIPEDLDRALTEVGVIRDCLVHRGGRIDAKALQRAPGLEARYREGDLIRVTCEDYRTYSAALRCYALEAITRFFSKWPWPFEVEEVDLEDWRAYRQSEAWDMPDLDESPRTTRLTF